jgi:hypothetical protein
MERKGAVKKDHLMLGMAVTANTGKKPFPGLADGWLYFTALRVQ